jgi:lipopolysaccharide/colanic/teichoic acid biosynthesis glycosyltransferase
VIDSIAPSGSDAFVEAAALKSTPFKWVLDLAIALLLLILLAPLMLLLALMVRLDSPGPALYRQQRIGRGGVPFTMLKFRSMRHSCSEDFHRQQSQNWFNGTAAPRGYKAGADPRLTRVGRYLRKTSLDEIPQLFNVIRGEMSLVGPRPLLPYERGQFERWHFERESVRPGITGLWQISGRDRLSAQEMMALDVRYVREWSLWLDIKVLARTAPAVVTYAGRRPANAGV